MDGPGLTRMLRSLLRWMKQIATALVVLVGLVCFFEIGLRVYDSHTGQVTRSGLFDQGVLTKSRFCHHEFKPLLRMKIPARGQEPEFDLQTNSLGLRGPEIDIPKPTGTYRIICLGDERTAGIDVAETDTFCQQMQALLQSRSRLRVEVLNAGTPDYCPLLSSLQFRQKLTAAQPDLVVLNWDMSDVWDDYSCRRYTTMGGRNQPLGCSHPLLDPPRQKAQQCAADLFLLPQFAVRNGCQVWAGRVLPPPPKEIDSPTGKYAWLQDQPPDWSVHVRQGLEAILPARDQAEGVGGTFLVAVHPAPWQVAATASSGEGVREAVGVAHGMVYRSRTPCQTIRDFCDEQQIWCCDLSPSIQADPLAVDLYQQASSNYTNLGHRLTARLIAGYIVKNIQGPWITLPRSQPPPTAPRNNQTARTASRER